AAALGEAEPLDRGLHVLVATPRQADEQCHVLRSGTALDQLATERERAGQGVRGLDRRDDALGAREQGERLHRLRVGDAAVAGAADAREPGVLGPYPRVVQTGGDRVRLDRLAVLVLQQVALRAVQHAGGALADRGGVPVGVDAVAGR